MAIKIVLKMSFLSIQNSSQKVVKYIVKISPQSKYSGSSPTLADCQKDSRTTVGNGTQVKPVILAVKIFAVCAT